MWLALGREVTSPWISVKRAGATVPQTERKWHNLGTRWGRHGSVFYLQTELDGSRPPSGCNGAESTGKRSTATRAGPPISHPAVVPWVEFCSSLVTCHPPLPFRSWLVTHRLSLTTALNARRAARQGLSPLAVPARKRQ